MTPPVSVSPASWREQIRAMLNAAPPREEDYPNRLQSPRVERPRPAPAWGLLTLLVAFTFIPRAWMAFCVDVVCSDGAYYISVAEALERGDLAQALNLQFNVFPVVLAGLHQLGLAWEMGGKMWCVAMATLAVLPLFGWLRRQFDDRVAAVACALYAVHPELIEWSPELVREPTFWFELTLSIYLLWRAVTEVRVLYFLAAGLTITLAALTRFEGLFLLVPLAAWGGLRLRALREQRLKLALGLIACPVALPALLLLINLCWLHHGSSWSLLRTEQLNRVWHWVESFAGGPPPSPIAGSETSSAVQSRPAQIASSSVAWQFFRTVERGMTPFFALLTVGGYAGWRRLIHRRDCLPLLAMAVLVCGGIWIHIWNTQQTSSRYVMFIVILTTPTAALGLIGLGHLVSGWRFTWPQFRQPANFVTAAIGVLAVIGWSDALSTQFHSREQSAALGDWIRDRYGQRRVIFGVDEQMAIISYHAHAYYWEPPSGVTGEALVELVDKSKPELIVVAKRSDRADDFTQLIQDGHRIGFDQVDPDLLPYPHHRVIVLSRLPMQVSRKGASDIIERKR